MFGLNSLLIALGGMLVAVTVAFFRGRIEGAKAERAKHAQAEISVRDIANEIQNDVGAMPPEIARKELGRWARK
jgi:hypothetical protein